MINGWTQLAVGLKSLYDELSATSSDDSISLAQDYFASYIDGQMNSIMVSIDNINAQMAGVEIKNISVAQQADWTAFAKQKVGVLV
jgi:hypothetical protein